jgi:DNA-binding winged helix-turn-helix (wHTH) protein
MPPAQAEITVLRFGAFTLEPHNARLLRDGVRVELPPRALDVLVHLAARSGELVTKDELLDAVWRHRHVSESVLRYWVYT